MHELTLLLILVVGFSLAFDFTNGFHDTANAVATVIATRVLPPNVAILMSAVLNFCGALVATNVAATVSKGVIDQSLASQTVVIGAVIGAIVWNLVTWFYGIPSSSSHALIGGLIGAGVAKGGIHIVLWKDIFYKVVLPLVLSPVIGGVIGLLIMSVLTYFFAQSHPAKVGTPFKRLQLLSSAAMSFSHGQNDGQKSMGIITLGLIAAGWLKHGAGVPQWVMLSCAAAMGLGTATGGHRIIKTVGQKIMRLEPVQGFAAETTAAAVILTASKLGMPVSTTHVLTGSVFGVGSAARHGRVRWQVAIRMVTAWVITIPASAAVGAGVYLAAHAFGLPA